MKIPNGWIEQLEEECSKEYYKELIVRIEEAYRKEVIYPPKEKVFTALQLTAYNDVKVVILGQDPYHDVNQAHGLAFSVERTVKIPKSLVNIYKELQEDISCGIPNHGNLEQWAKQGVLLLNTVLTVKEHTPESHKNMGWEIFTDAIIRKLNDGDTPIVFILWGKNAREKSKLVTNQKHYIIESPHPSPLSAYRGFFGSKPFSRTNDFLTKEQLTPVNWEIES